VGDSLPFIPSTALLIGDTMGRSLKKGPYADPKLLEKVRGMNARNEKKAIKTWSRRSTIFPDFIGHTMLVHDGRKHIPIFITENMSGTSWANSRSPACSVVTPVSRSNAAPASSNLIYGTSVPVWRCEARHITLNWWLRPRLVSPAPVMMIDRYGIR